MPDSSRQDAPRPGLVLVILILAGEVVFALPFHVARFFRPTLLSTLGIDNQDLGWMQSAYGLTAMLSYAPGGWLADRYPARRLVPISLVLTALGGLYLVSLPSRWGLLMLHLYWGVTTILFFWGALIRATRDDAPGQSQGKAFGVLDGGRGLVAALVASVGVFLLGRGSSDRLTGDVRAERLVAIVAMYTGVTLVMALVSWWGLRRLPQELATAGAPPEPMPVQAPSSDGARREEMAHSFRRHVLHGTVILAAYCGYKGIDFYSTWATTVFSQTEVEAAKWATWGVWLRPPAALIAGWWADRSSARYLTRTSFLLLTGSYAATAVFLAARSGANSWPVVFLAVNVIGTSVLLYALRALYFVLLAESGVPRRSTGTAVGLVSVMGFAPDFFFPAWAGMLVEGGSTPERGYAALFALLAGFSLAGAGAVSALTSSRRTT